MRGLLFVAQSQLDAWLEEGVADVDATGLHLRGAPAIDLTPACRVVELLEGEDQAGLLGKVATEARLREAGGEPYGDSLLLGDVVYTVEPGFVASLELQAGMPAAGNGVGRSGADASRAGPAGDRRFP